MDFCGWLMILMLPFAGKSLEGVAHPSPLNMGYLMNYHYSNGPPLAMVSLSFEIFFMFVCPVMRTMFFAVESRIA